LQEKSGETTRGALRLDYGGHPVSRGSMAESTRQEENTEQTDSAEVGVAIPKFLKKREGIGNNVVDNNTPARRGGVYSLNSERGHPVKQKNRVYGGREEKTKA